MTDIKDTKAYSINDFLNWYDNDELTLSPKYQRNAVWGNNVYFGETDHVIPWQTDHLICLAND